MTLSVLVPYRPDDGHRTMIWNWIEKRYAALLPDVELIVASDDDGDNPGQFNHPLAINRAAARATGDVFMVADCDTAFEPSFVLRAAQLVETGEANWVLPRFYAKLTESSSMSFLERSPTVLIDKYVAEWIGNSQSWAGLVTVSRSAFEAVGGYDERFAYWGSDDSSFGLTMDALCGRHTRLEGAALHFWHPQPLDETYGHDRHRQQHELAMRYIDAATTGDVDEMRKVRFT